LTGQASEESAVEAFRRGASDCVAKDNGFVAALASRVCGLVAG
jgi:hypothetical protein